MAAAIVAGLLWATAAGAAARELNGVPTGWKLENYPGGSVVVWHVAPECANGRLTLPASTTTDDKQRLWSVVLSAIVANHKVFVTYDTKTCVLASFGMYGG